MSWHERQDAVVYLWAAITSGQRCQASVGNLEARGRFRRRGAGWIPEAKVHTPVDPGCTYASCIVGIVVRSATQR